VHLGRDPAEMRQLTRDKLAEMVKYLTGEMDRNNEQKSLIVAVEPSAARGLLRFWASVERGIEGGAPK